MFEQFRIQEILFNDHVVLIYVYLNSWNIRSKTRGHLMGLLGGLNWNVAHFCVVKENIQLEYGHVTPQISPNLMLSANS